jgi:hypothetical protein
MCVQDVMLDVVRFVVFLMGALPILGAFVCTGECQVRNGCSAQVYNQPYEEEGFPKRGCEESWVHLLQVL